MRRLVTKALKAYGPGVGHLEEVMNETIIDIVDVIQGKDGEPMSTRVLCHGYICCVLASMV